jgi:hypothetical protein
LQLSTVPGILGMMMIISSKVSSARRLANISGMVKAGLKISQVWVFMFE